MKTAIVGGHGKIALVLTTLIRERGEDVRGLIRDPAQAEDVRAAGGEPVVLDLEKATDDEIDASLIDCDAIVFAAGAGPGSGAGRKETVDYGGAVRTIEAAGRAGISRYVMISSVGADPDATGDDVFAVYLRAKGRADRVLADSGLDFTIVRPVALTDEVGTGRVAVGDRELEPTVPREDVAEALAEVLMSDETIGLTVNLSTGETLIAEAIAALD